MPYFGIIIYYSPYTYLLNQIQTEIPLDMSLVQFLHVDLRLLKTAMFKEQILLYRGVSQQLSKNAAGE